MADPHTTHIQLASLDGKNTLAQVLPPPSRSLMARAERAADAARSVREIVQRIMSIAELDADPTVLRALAREALIEARYAEGEAALLVDDLKVQ